MQRPPSTCYDVSKRLPSAPGGNKGPYLEIDASDKIGFVTTQVATGIRYVSGGRAAPEWYGRDESCPVLFGVGLAEKQM